MRSRRIRRKGTICERRWRLDSGHSLVGRRCSALLVVSDEAIPTVHLGPDRGFEQFCSMGRRQRGRRDATVALIEFARGQNVTDEGGANGFHG